jgi:hypothetical protein
VRFIAAALNVVTVLNVHGDHHEGLIQKLILALLGVVLVITAMDMMFWWHEAPSVAYRIQGWSANHPLLAAGLAVVLGAMLGHFFWFICPACHPQAYL